MTLGVTAVRVALVGCGARGLNSHGRTLARSGRFDLRAVCDVDAGRLAAASAALGVPGETDHRRLVKRGDIDAVVIATSARHHAPVALDAIRARKHVLVEKPLAESSAAAFAVASAAADAGVVGLVGYQFFFSAFGRALKREAEAVEPLQILVNAQRGPLRAPFFFPDHYGGVMDHTTHDLQLAMWLMGGPPAGVYGALTRGTLLGDDTIEAVTALLEYDGGQRSAAVVGSMLAVQKQRLVQVVGQRGSVVSLDRRVLHVLRHPGLGGPGIVPSDRFPVSEVLTEGEGGGSNGPGFGSDPSANMLAHFADLVDGRARSSEGASLLDGAYAVAVTEALERAARTGQRVAPAAQLQP